MKETLTKLATGFIAKGIRYALTAWGGMEMATSDGEINKLAAGAATIAIAFAQSVWEDAQKKKLSTPAQPQP